MSGKNLLRLRASLSMLVFQYPASMCDSMQKALQRHRRLKKVAARVAADKSRETSKLFLA